VHREVVGNESPKNRQGGSESIYAEEKGGTNLLPGSKRKKGADGGTGGRTPLTLHIWDDNHREGADIAQNQVSPLFEGKMTRLKSAQNPRNLKTWRKGRPTFPRKETNKNLWEEGHVGGKFGWDEERKKKLRP